MTAHQLWARWRRSFESDHFCSLKVRERRHLDGRKRRRGGIATTVGALAPAEGLRPVPAHYPAVLEVSRTISKQARISFRGNIYSVPPGHAGRQVLVRHRLDDVALPTALEAVTDTGVVLAATAVPPTEPLRSCVPPSMWPRFRRVVLANFADRPPCRRTHRRPPTAAALAEADRIRGAIDAVEGQQVVVDFARYAARTQPIRPARDAGQAQ